MAQYINITKQEFEDYILPLGFKPITLPYVKEAVYGKIIGPNLCLRIFSGIVSGTSRKCGKDAIRAATVYRKEDGKISPVGRQRRVHRVLGWRENLANRIRNATADITVCSCGKPMTVRKNHRTDEKFMGCVGYPECQNTKPYKE